MRPLPRTSKGRTIAASPPDATAQWVVAGRTIQAQLWDNLVLSRKAKKWECLAVAAFRAPRLPVCLLTIPPPEVSYSFLMASHHFWGSTEIDENVSLTLL